MLNLLTSELVAVGNPLSNDEVVRGVFLLDSQCVIYGRSQWVLLTMQGSVVERHEEIADDATFQLLVVDFISLVNYHFIFWTGLLEDKRLLLKTVSPVRQGSLALHSALVMSKKRQLLFACADPGPNVVAFQLSAGTSALHALICHCCYINCLVLR